MEVLDEGIDLAFFAFAGDGFEHGGDVGLGEEVLLAVAAFVDACDDAPVLEGSEGHGGVAARDAEAGHDVVGAEWEPGDVEEGVDLGHGARDAPGGAHLAPGGDEAVLCLEDGRVGLGRRALRIVLGVRRGHATSHRKIRGWRRSGYKSFRNK